MAKIIDISKLKYDNVNNRWMCGRSEVSKMEAITAIMKTRNYAEDSSGFTAAEIELQQIRNKKDEPTITVEDLYRMLVDRHKIFDNWVLVTVGHTGTLDVTKAVVYYRRDSLVMEPVCPYIDFKPARLDLHMQVANTNTWADIVDSGQRMLNPEGIHEITSEEVFKGIFAVIKPITKMERIHLKEQPAACAIESSSAVTFHRIPYTAIEGDLDLIRSKFHPYLIDFLLRCQYHEYVCAYLWQLFLGLDVVELIYLKGSGGDGKTAFVTMLGRLVTLARLPTEDIGRFDIFSVYDKAILNVSENKNPYLMKNTIIKTITGSAVQRVEQKNKDAFSGVAKGMIIADSNYDLCLEGQEFESRRLRYFHVKPLTLDDTQKPRFEYLVDCYSSTPNEFLNYCRLCYESLATSQGTVLPPPNHKESLNSLLDLQLKNRYKKIYTKLLQDYVEDPEGEADAEEVVGMVCDMYVGNNPYLIREFNTFLQGFHGIEYRGGKYLGLKRMSKFEKFRIGKSSNVKDLMPEVKNEI